MIKADLTKSVQLYNEINIKMCTIFMKSVNSKTSDACSLRLNVTDKMDLQGGNRHVELLKLRIYCRQKNMKSTKMINLDS